MVLDYGQNIQQTRDEFGEEPDTFPVIKIKRETVKIEELSTLGRERDIGDSFILGHATNGVLGTSNGNILGADYGSYTWDFVTNPNNIFNEYFRNNTFCNTTNTTANWDTTDLRAEFDAYEVLETNSIFKNNETVLSVTPHITEDSGSVAIFANASGSTTQFKTGTITGATYVTGNVGNYALSFDGVNDLVATPTDIVCDLEHTSISMWIKRTVTNYESLLGKGNGTMSLLEIDKGDVVGRFYFEPDVNNRGYTISTGVNTSDGNWHHLVFLFSKNGGTGYNAYEIYIDGVSKGTANDAAWTTTFTFNKIGNQESQVTYIYGEFYEGLIDDVRVYNKVLSSTEISTLYNKGNVTDSLTLHYGFEEGSGTKVFDTSQWERCTNNTEHQMITTGTDLKLKLVEDAGSTAQVSKIKVEYSTS